MRTLLGPAMVILVLGGAWVHGSATHRWQETSSELGRFQPLHAHTVTLGDYVATSIPNDIPLKEKSVGSSKRYISQSRQQGVVVSIITGAPGSVATHTPDVCYPGSGYKTVKAPVRETIELPGMGTVSYMVAEFEKKNATSVDRQRVRWAWTVGGAGSNWEVPSRPRLHYLREADLAKIYVVTLVPTPESKEASNEGDSAVIREFFVAALTQYAQLAQGD